MCSTQESYIEKIDKIQHIQKHHTNPVLGSSWKQLQCLFFWPTLDCRKCQSHCSGMYIGLLTVN